MNLLEVKNLHVSVGDQPVLQGIDLEVPPGELHVIMGPNGSGKSTLVQTLAGSETYTVREGDVRFAGENLLLLKTEERAQRGLFLAFQYPVEIPGLSNALFLRTIVNTVRKTRGLPEWDAMDFLTRARSALEQMGMKPELLERAVNQGFSGGEKKRNEILQLRLLEPRLALLDETDSGLDIDALRTVAREIEAMRNLERSFLVVTHYQRMLDYLRPDQVHVLVHGRIIQSGQADLAKMLEKRGYDWLLKEHRA